MSSLWLPPRKTCEEWRCGCCRKSKKWGIPFPPDAQGRVRPRILKLLIGVRRAAVAMSAFQRRVFQQNRPPAPGLRLAMTPHSMRISQARHSLLAHAAWRTFESPNDWVYWSWNMDENRKQGAKHEVTGKVKEATGKVTGNRTKQAAGNLEKNAGKVQREVGKQADEARKENEHHHH